MGIILKFGCSTLQPYGCEGQNGGQGHAPIEEFVPTKFDLDCYLEDICYQNVICAATMKGFENLTYCGCVMNTFCAIDAIYVWYGFLRLLNIDESQYYW